MMSYLVRVFDDDVAGLMKFETQKRTLREAETVYDKHAHALILNLLSNTLLRYK